jgi:hypothetical protein
MLQSEECCQIPTVQHCNFSVRKEDRCPNQKSAAKANCHSTAILASQGGSMPQSEECCQSLGTPRRQSLRCPTGRWGNDPPLGRFQGRSGVVLIRNGRRLAGAPTSFSTHYHLQINVYSHPVAPSRFHRRCANISYINTTNMCALIKLQLPLIFVLPTRDVHV